MSVRDCACPGEVLRGVWSVLRELSFLPMGAAQDPGSCDWLQRWVVGIQEMFIYGHSLGFRKGTKETMALDRG